jgi:predicted MFS family arabinose efflux permease
MLWLGALGSFIGTWIHNTAARWTAVSLSDKAIVVGSLDFLAMAPLAFLAVPAGRLADTMDRRRFLLVTNTGLAISTALLAGVAYMGWLGVPNLLLLTLFSGVFSAFQTPAWQATVPRQVPDSLVPRAVALMSMGFNGARAIGPTLGAYLLQYTGAAFAFAINAATYIMVSLMLARLPPQPPVAADSGESDFFQNPLLKRLLVLVFLFNIPAVSTITLLPVLAKTTFSGQVTSYGHLLGGFGVGAVGGALVLATRNLERRGRAMVGGSFLVSLGSLILGVVEVEGLAIAGTFLCGIGWTFTLVNANALVQLRAPAAGRSRILAWYLSAAVFGQAGGSLLSGALADWIGAQSNYQVDAVLLVGMTVAIWACKLDKA